MYLLNRAQLRFQAGAIPRGSLFRNIGRPPVLLGSAFVSEWLCGSSARGLCIPSLVAICGPTLYRFASGAHPIGGLSDGSALATECDVATMVRRAQDAYGIGEWELPLPPDAFTWPEPLLAVFEVPRAFRVLATWCTQVCRKDPYPTIYAAQGGRTTMVQNMGNVSPRNMRLNR
jgi:hypothetical protein